MKKMLINAVHPEEVRVAVVEDGVLKELYIESALKEQLRGNLYKARIDRIETGLNAVFVDYGREKNGFLPVGDINPAFLPGTPAPHEIFKHLHKGMEIMVQVGREEKSAKGALLTMNISLPGRHMVLLPHQETAGISRKIEDEDQRMRLKDIIKQIGAPADMGIIVRTAGMDRTKAELSRDLNYLLRLWKSIQSDFKEAACPSLIYREGDIIIRSIRDYFTSDMKEILIDDEETGKRAVQFMKTVMPWQAKLIKPYRESRPIFAKYELERQLQEIYAKKVRLKSGGSIVIDTTEALVAIDVNSGQGTSSRDMEATALTTNLEAAEEIARQLILRDLGGLIVIDFIDMRSKESIRKVEKALKEGLKTDRAHLKLGRISLFGLMQLSRERLSPPLYEKSHVMCPHCQGTGMLRSVESSAFMALRDIHLALNRNHTARLRVTLAPEVAAYLLNQQRRHLVRLEQDFGTEIHIFADADTHRGEVNIESPAADGTSPL